MIANITRICYFQNLSNRFTSNPIDDAIKLDKIKFYTNFINEYIDISYYMPMYENLLMRDTEDSDLEFLIYLFKTFLDSETKTVNHTKVLEEVKNIEPELDFLKEFIIRENYTENYYTLYMNKIDVGEIDDTPERTFNVTVINAIYALIQQLEIKIIERINNDSVYLIYGRKDSINRLTKMNFVQKITPVTSDIKIIYHAVEPCSEPLYLLVLYINANADQYENVCEFAIQKGVKIIHTSSYNYLSINLLDKSKEILKEFLELKEINCIEQQGIIRPFA